MHELFVRIAALGAANHGIVSNTDLARSGISVPTRTRWQAAGLLVRLGPDVFAVRGAPPTWEQRPTATEITLDDRGFLAGRTAARLQRLDGFSGDAVEVLAHRRWKDLVVDARLASTALPLDAGDTVIVDGFRCLTAERLILDSPLFGFTQAETENAIDSAIRLRLVSEQRLRTKVIARHNRGINGGRTLLEALVDSGGESRLERWMLRIVREAGLPRPELQMTYREGTRVVARVDMQFGDLVVEIAGHGSHSNRAQLQVDDQRRTELIKRGLRVVTFRYEDVRHRPAWVIEQLRALTASTGRAA
ncbi:MAG: hypothetical protein ABIR68_08360 [Ilumatobacteraceae bacterium]